MKKFRVNGQYIATISKEVWAEDESEAIEIASDTFGGVYTYINNCIGVDGEGEDIEAHGEADWNDPYIELLEENNNVRKCPECEYCVEEIDREYNGKNIWYCDECGTYFDNDGNTYDEDNFEEEDE